MTITNKTKKNVLSNHAFEAITLLDRGLGLLNTTKPRALILHTHFGIHTFGMKEAIDVVILDHTCTVVRVKEELHPNRIFLWPPPLFTSHRTTSRNNQKNHNTTGRPH